jgi:hypothetical protein
MSRDGLLPAWFAQVHPRFRTPHRPTLIAGGLTALIAGFFPIKEVAELVNIGTLSAFVIICLAVIVLRRTRPDVRRTFKTPFVPWIPLAGIGFSLWLLSKLPAVAWERFVVWMALGLLLYFSYGRWHSVLAKRGSVPFEGKSIGDAQSHRQCFFSCRQEEVDLRPLNGGALGLNAESPIGREPSGRPRRSTRGTSRFQRSLASAMRLARRSELPRPSLPVAISAR